MREKLEVLGAIGTSLLVLTMVVFLTYTVSSREAEPLAIETSGGSVGAGSGAGQVFIPSGGYYKAASTTARLQMQGLSNCNTIDTDSQGRFSCGTDETGGGGGSGTVGTSTIPTVGQLAYWTSNGYPSLLGSVATGTLSASSPLSLTGTTVIVGTSRTLSLDTSGTWTGNAGTATALAANGSNCSAGNFPLGVDASGAVESCTDAWTEAENTAAAYFNALADFTGTLTDGKLCRYDQAGGEIDCDYTDVVGSGGTGIATSGPIADTEVIYGTGVGTVDSEAAFTYNYGADRLTVSFASTTAFSSPYASSTSAFFGALTLPNLTSGGLAVNSSGQVYKAATTTFNSPLSYSGGAVSLTTSGTWTGNAGTATALAANGADCTSGNAPLGVDASGAVESCFDVWTEAENTAAAYTPQSRTLTIAGTTNQITSSAGAQDLTSNKTWTLSIPSQFNIQNASTTNLSANTLAVGATATSSISSGGILTLGTLTGSTQCLQVNSSGVVSGTGSACGAGGGSGGGTWATTTSQTVGVLINYPLNDDDIVVVGSNATTTAEIILDPNTSTITVGTGGAGDSTATFGPNTNNQWITGYDETDKSFAIASSSALGTTNFLTITKTGYRLDQLTSNGLVKTSGSNGALSIAANGTDYTLVSAVSCTNQVMTALTASGSGTCSSINNAYWSGTDLSVANGGTGLSTFGGTNHVLYTTAADALSSEAAFTYNPSTNTLVADNVSLSSTGNLIIPATGNPTVSTSGELDIDTTAASSSLRWYDGTTEHAIYDTIERSWPVASSTLAYMGSYGASGTTTILLANHKRAKTVTSAYCKTDTGTAHMNFSDGSNRTADVTCSTTPTLITFSTNNTWTQREDFKVDVGRQASTPNVITITWEEVPLD